MLKIIKIDSTGEKEPTLKEKREFIKNHGGYEPYYSDFWTPIGITENLEQACIKTEELYNALTYEELPIVYK